MVAEMIFLLQVALKLLVLVCTCLLLSLLLTVRFGETAEEYGDARLERCRAFLPVPGVMQTVQRAEFWGAIIALQAYWPCHLGTDNLNVARSIGRLLDFDWLHEVERRFGSQRLWGVRRMLMFNKVGFGC